MIDLVVGWMGVWMGVEESDEGDDGVGDDVSSEKLSPGGCWYEGLSESIELVSLLHVRVQVRVLLVFFVRGLTPLA